MNLTNLQKLIAVVTLQTIIIFAIIIFKVSVLASGTSVLLHIQPVDPRDPLRGDFVTFTYDISTVSNYYSGPGAKNGDSVYVELVRQGKYWVVLRGASLTKPINGSLFIKGTVVSGGAENRAVPTKVLGRNSQQLRITYGLEQYFIPEGTGRGFRFDGDVSAVVVIDDEGNAVLKQLLINDKPWP
jgi:uncharacterized membrane-anchored protein